MSNLPTLKRRPAGSSTEFAIIFPGQGSQSLGMASEVLRVYGGARKRFERASQILGYDLIELIEGGPVEDLDRTSYSQPAIYTASIAWFDALQDTWKRTGRTMQPIAVAGHSSGQIAAVVAAGALDFEDGLRLVEARGRLMHAADQDRPGGMASIIGLRNRAVNALVGEAAQDDTLVVANENCPGHIVVSGDEGALRRLMRSAEEQGARRVVRLPISIASHSPLMKQAQEQFREVVDAMPWRDPSVPVISNITAGFLLTQEAIAEEIHDSLCKPVRWTDSVRAMVNQGADLFVEAGPGDVLSKLVRRIASKAWTFPLSDERVGLAQHDYPDMSSGIPK